AGPGSLTAAERPNLKSRAPKRAYRFDSDPGHQTKISLISRYPRDFYPPGVGQTPQLRLLCCARICSWNSALQSGECHPDTLTLPELCAYVCTLLTFPGP